MTHITPDHRSAFIADVRTFADFLTATPNVPVPAQLDVAVFPTGGGDEVRRAEIDRIAAVLGTTTECDAGHYRTSKTFGRVSYRAVAVSDGARERWDALMSYDGAITPDLSPRRKDGR
ncbi:hypothetical protein ACQP2K_40600 [Microbispora siamensis]